MVLSPAFSSLCTHTLATQDASSRGQQATQACVRKIVRPGSRLCYSILEKARPSVQADRRIDARCQRISGGSVVAKSLRERRVVCPDCIVGMRLRGKSRLKYVCQECGASLIANKYGQPLGTPATKEVRRLRMRAHIAFDQLWKPGEVTRSSAQRWIANELGVPFRKCHFGYMNRQQLEVVIGLSNAVLDGTIRGPTAIDRDPITSQHRRMANEAIKLLRQSGAHPTALRYWVAHHTQAKVFVDVGGLSSEECKRLVARCELVFSGRAKPPRGAKLDKRLQLAAISRLRTNERN